MHAKQLIHITLINYYIKWCRRASFNSSLTNDLYLHNKYMTNLIAHVISKLATTYIADIIIMIIIKALHPFNMLAKNKQTRISVQAWLERFVSDYHQPNQKWNEMCLSTANNNIDSLHHRHF